MNTYTYTDPTNRNSNGEAVCEACGTTDGNVDIVEYLDGDRWIATYTLCENEACHDMTDSIDRDREDARAEWYAEAYYY